MQFKFKRNKVWLFLTEVLEISAPHFETKRLARFSYAKAEYTFPF
jgi:hypothetical protein